MAAKKEDTNTTEVAIAEVPATAVMEGPSQEELMAYFGGAANDLGMENIGANDIKMPGIKIIQSTSVEANDEKIPGSTPGAFYNRVSGKCYKELYCTFLMVKAGSVMWPAQFKRNDKPLCRSVDRVTGQTNEGTTENCKGCPNHDWGADGTKALCRDVYSFLGILLDEETCQPIEGEPPFRISMAGAAVPVVKNFVTQLRTGSAPMLAHILRIGTEKKTNENGTFYLPTIQFITKKDNSKLYHRFETLDTLKGTLAGMRDLFNTNFEADIDSQDVSATSADDGDGVF